MLGGPFLIVAARRHPPVLGTQGLHSPQIEDTVRTSSLPHGCHYWHHHLELPLLVVPMLQVLEPL